MDRKRGNTKRNEKRNEAKQTLRYHKREIMHIPHALWSMPHAPCPMSNTLCSTLQDLHGVHVNSRTSLSDMFICRRCSKLSRDVCLRKWKASLPTLQQQRQQQQLIGKLIYAIALFLHFFFFPAATNSNFDIIFLFFASFLTFVLANFHLRLDLKRAAPASASTHALNSGCARLLRWRPWELHLALIYRPATCSVQHEGAPQIKVKSLNARLTHSAWSSSKLPPPCSKPRSGPGALARSSPTLLLPPPRPP